MLIRDATDDDWPAIYPIFSAIVEAGETYAYPLGLSLEDFQIQNISLPDELQKRLDERIGMGIVGDTNGEQALWIDGKQVSHLGKGFPKGLWTFDKFHPGRGRTGVRWNDAKGERASHIFLARVHIENGGFVEMREGEPPQE